MSTIVWPSADPRTYFYGSAANKAVTYARNCIHSVNEQTHIIIRDHWHKLRGHLSALHLHIQAVLVVWGACYAVIAYMSACMYLIHCCILTVSWWGPDVAQILSLDIEAC